MMAEKIPKAGRRVWCGGFKTQRRRFVPIAASCRCTRGESWQVLEAFFGEDRRNLTRNGYLVRKVTLTLGWK